MSPVLQKFGERTGATEVHTDWWPDQTAFLYRLVDYPGWLGYSIRNDEGADMMLEHERRLYGYAKTNGVTIKRP